MGAGGRAGGDHPIEADGWTEGEAGVKNVCSPMEIKIFSKESTMKSAAARIEGLKMKRALQACTKRALSRQHTHAHEVAVEDGRACVASPVVLVAECMFSSWFYL